VENFYEKYPSLDLLKEFESDKVKYVTFNSDILRCCGKNAYKLKHCKKEKYGFRVVYILNEGTFDKRDSNEVESFISFSTLMHGNHSRSIYQSFKVKDGDIYLNAKAILGSSTVEDFEELGNNFDEIADKNTLVCPVKINDKIKWAIYKNNQWELLTNSKVKNENIS